MPSSTETADSRWGGPAHFGRKKPRLIRSVLLAILAVTACTTAVRAQIDYEHPPINYLTSQPTDAVARLNAKLESGTLSLTYEPEKGYLPSVLSALNIRPTSQMLVFSKTSFQLSRISPRRPRAIYFNDNVYLGCVQQGDVLEISATDPDLGAVFYTLEQRKTDRPRFVRQTHRCLLCHGSSQTGGVPGHLARSVYPDRGGQPMFAAGTFRIDYRSPVKDRWGGWYVSGTHGPARHMGNVMVSDPHEPEQLDRERGANITDLSQLLDVSPYLTPHSDLIALMVMEYQIAVHNRLTSAGFRGRMTTRDAGIMNAALEREKGYESDSTRRRYDSAAADLVEVLLMAGEATLEAPVKGTSGFAEQFSARGPHDRQGRSLYQLDLKTRLFKYPCSYLIYGDSFDSLPDPVRIRVLRGLWEVLTGQNSDPKFSHLGRQDRAAILEIVRDTKRNLPRYWMASTGR